MKTPNAWLSGVVLSLGVLSFYLLTLSPALTWGDGARLQMEVMIGGANYFQLGEFQELASGRSLPQMGIMPWDHPLYLLIGRLLTSVPFVDPLLTINLFSSICGAGTVLVVYFLCRQMHVGSRAAVLGALTLAVSHTFWFHSVTAEVYTLHTLFEALLLLYATRFEEKGDSQDLAMMALIAGLGLANHLMLVLAIGPVAWFVASSARRIDLRTCAWAVLAFALGFSPWWIQFLEWSRVFGLQLTVQAATWSQGLFRLFGSLSWISLIQNSGEYVLLLAYQFTPLGLLAGINGAITLRQTHRRYAGLFLWMYCCHVLFSANFPVGDRFAFHLPSYLLFSVFIACSLGRVKTIGRSWLISLSLGAAALLPIGIYSITPQLLGSFGCTERQLGIPEIGAPYRDGLSYYLNPNKAGDHSASDFVHALLRDVDAGAVILAPHPDLEVYLLVRYCQLVDGIRTDVRVMPFAFMPTSQVREQMGKWLNRTSSDRPIYLASLAPKTYPLSTIESRFDVTPECGIYRLRIREKSTGPAPRRELTTPSPRTLKELIRQAIR